MIDCHPLSLPPGNIMHVYSAAAPGGSPVPANLSCEAGYSIIHDGGTLVSSLANITLCHGGLGWHPRLERVCEPTGNFGYHSEVNHILKLFEPWNYKQAKNEKMIVFGCPWAVWQYQTVIIFPPAKRRRLILGYNELAGTLIWLNVMPAGLYVGGMLL